MSRRFETVLIANRGEIACRIIRTARAEGYRIVAVYSDADADALHVRMADEAVRIGPPAVSESYLNMDRIIEAATRSGAGAVHPGYGFLSENAAFAEACAKAAIVFIGPPADAIAKMGNKAAAKRLMFDAGVPCVPGYEGAAQDDATLAGAAQTIGFPVLLKAAAGGGGRGMRRVDNAEDFGPALAQARGEAKNAFGSDELIIEKLIERARHVEIQVFGDEHGHLIHLGERDCSVQRRHQKIIEESPCPVMTSELRARMGEAAVKAANAVGYTNAGTVEFLLDASGHFYFLEMNTRLQVEHPVTEAVTGLDLVALQLAVAQGHTLPITQEDVCLEGHAIEVRLYAEDPYQDFAPQTGTVLAWGPASGPGVRTDHGLHNGARVTPFYDAMIAKVIACGVSRDEARRRLVHALRDTCVLGLQTNRIFLEHVLAHPAFAEGEATTGFIAESRLLEDAEHTVPPETLLIAAALYIERDAQGLPANMKGWRSTGPPAIPIKLKWHEELFELSVSMSGSRYSITQDETEFAVEAVHFDHGTARFRNGEHQLAARFAFDGSRLYLDFGGCIEQFEDVTYAPPNQAEAAGQGTLRAPMVGQVVELNVQVGDVVEKDQVVVVLEAMKMVNHITAPHAGIVESISIALGDHVEANRVLAVIADIESG